MASSSLNTAFYAAQRRHPIPSSSMVGLMQELGASDEQHLFFEIWAQRVYDRLLPKSMGEVLLVSLDFTYLELQITGPLDIMIQHIEELMREAGIPDRPRELARQSPGSHGRYQQISRLQEMAEALLHHEDQDAQHDDSEEPALTLWCKFKHIRTDVATADAGFRFNTQLDWSVADLLMPWHADQDALRDYAVTEKHLPAAFGQSIFPLETECLLEFHMDDKAGHSNKTQVLMHAFFFFKCFGFAKPEDHVVRTLGEISSGKFLLSVTMGPKGLTRLSLGIIEPSKDPPKVAKHLAETLNVPYNERNLATLLAASGLPGSNVFEFVATANGWSITLGFAG